MSINDNECLSCGLCCIFYPSMSNDQSKWRGQWGVVLKEDKDTPKSLYNVVTEEEEVIPSYKDPEIFKNVKGFIKDKRDPIWKNHRRCVALDGTQCQKVTCSIYSNRPKTCSSFEVASSMCNTIRKWGGLEEI